ncbi:unnamed protein product [Thelazia callipaeda]|uniref:Secreted protein n=1 Tax=Thelazia callipaeda TaxID=103827 RepID=A0A0N5DC95_THECL|nr:unnamed protein product [Thelazia callipaeda]
MFPYRSHFDGSTNQLYTRFYSPASCIALHGWFSFLFRYARTPSALLMRFQRSMHRKNNSGERLSAWRIPRFIFFSITVSPLLFSRPSGSDAFQKSADPRWHVKPFNALDQVS